MGRFHIRCAGGDRVWVSRGSVSQRETLWSQEAVPLESQYTLKLSVTIASHLFTLVRAGLQSSGPLRRAFFSNLGLSCLFPVRQDQSGIC